MDNENTGRLASFRQLPPELRHQVWLHALGSPTVVTLASHHEDPSVSEDKQRLTQLTSTGSSTAISVGSSCREARWAFRKSHFRLSTELGACWTNYDATVLDLGFVLWPFESRSLLRSISTDSLVKIRHVALVWTHFRHVARACMELAAKCHSLQTIIIDMHWYPRTMENSITDWQDLSKEKGLYKSNASAYLAAFGSGSVTKTPGRPSLPQWPELNAMLLAYFQLSSPKLHFVRFKDEWVQ